MILTIGIKGTEKSIVTLQNTAKGMGSGELEVYATPAMIALMEYTANKSVSSYLDINSGTVGTSIEVRHVSPTPVGMTVRCESELIEIDRKRLVFSLSVYDDSGLIGEGTHTRFIIDNQRFIEKANSKKKNIKTNE